MNRKSIAMLAAAMLIALSLMSTAAFAEGGGPSTTTATIGFIDGDLEFVDGDLGSGMKNMSISFGDENKLPSKAETYLAVDGSHTLRVKDERASAGSWKVTVVMSAFANQSVSGNSFDGSITLTSPSINSATNSTGFAAESSVIISSNESSVTVVSAGTVVHGIFDTIWTQDNIKLAIDDDAAAATQGDCSYVADLVWTLSIL